MKNSLLAMFLVFGLVISFISPAALLAQDDKNPQINSEIRFLTDYGKLLSGYAKDCASLRDEPRPNAQQWKKCHTISKGLLDKLSNFRAILETLREKIKGVNKWNSELDAEITKNGVKLGLEQNLINLIEENGGLRSSYEKSFNALGQLRTGLQEDIEYFESSKDSAIFDSKSSNSVSFVKASAKKNSVVRASKWVCIGLFMVAIGGAAAAGTGVGAGVAVAAGANLAGAGCLAKMF